MKKLFLAIIMIVSCCVCSACDPAMFEPEESTPYATDDMPRHTVGEVIESSGFEIEYLSFDKRDELTDGYVAKDGYDYYVFEFEFKNISDTEKHVYYGCFGCYADGVWVEQTYNYDGIIKGNLVDNGDKTKGTVAFMVPENAKLVEMIFQYRVEDERLVFSVE